MESLLAVFNKLARNERTAAQPRPVLPSRLSALTLEGVAKAIKDGTCKNIIIMSGAGISVAAGIPDFRSPGTGLYDNLQKYNLPHPTAVFEIDYFRQNPKPFFTLAKELYPGCFKPTAAHYFARLLHEKGKLLRVFTQNIDTLERIAGVPDDVIVEAHGSFASATCIDCGAKYSLDFVKTAVFSDQIPHCTNAECSGVVKPDIVFFGEGLPDRFHTLRAQDFPQCDLLIVMGTSLAVQPFASLVNHVPDETPRLLLNMEAVGVAVKDDFIARLLGESKGFRFDEEDNYRDVKHLGDVQASVMELTRLLGWEDDLRRLMALAPIDIAAPVAAAAVTTTTTTANEPAPAAAAAAAAATTEAPAVEPAAVPTTASDATVPSETTAASPAAASESNTDAAAAPAATSEPSDADANASL